jgi:dephospho-CoA kinase
LKVIGLTGGVASGKSEAARFFATRGVPVIYADAVARSVRSKPAVMQQISDLLGVPIEDGHLGAGALRAVIFADADKRHAMEALLHPLIRQRIETELSGLDSPLAIVEIPLLFEAGWDDMVDETVLVTADDAIRQTRLQARDEVTDALAQRMLASQMPEVEKKSRADIVLTNNDNLATLQQHAEQLLVAWGWTKE